VSGISSNGRAASPIGRAAAEFQRMTGQRVERVVGMTRMEDGWGLTLEVVELERVPDSTNVIATYDLSVGEDGDLREFTRTRRYYRNMVDHEDDG
jgi:hypothetical protein